MQVDMEHWLEKQTVPNIIVGMGKVMYMIFQIKSFVNKVF